MRDCKKCVVFGTDQAVNNCHPDNKYNDDRDFCWCDGIDDNGNGLIRKNGCYSFQDV